jgi:Group 4 capsule polysaccharide lipoprotein gfcB, YjbF
MGTGVAVTSAVRLTAGLALLAILAGCGSDKSRQRPLLVTVGAIAVSSIVEMGSRRSGAKTAAKAPPTRAELEKAGAPVLRAAIPNLGADRFLTVFDRKGEVVTWKTTDGSTFSLRSGILIQTRGLGPDLMSSNVPTVGQLLQDGGTHQRQYFFLGGDDQTTRRTYECTVRIVGQEEITIFEKKHQVTRATEECARPQSGKITNEFWIEGQTVRQSRQWASALTGYIEFQKVVD